MLPKQKSSAGEPGRRSKLKQKRWLVPGAGLIVILLITALVWLGQIDLNRNPLQGGKLFVDPESNAARQAKQWQDSKPAEAALLQRLAAQPTAKWLTSSDSLESLKPYLDNARAADAVPVLVAYNLPLRDCGLYSAGGADSPAQYRRYIDQLAGRIGGQPSVVIIEPDALPTITGNGAGGKPCLNNAQRQQRFGMLKYAVERLKQSDQTAVYLDAGNSAWVKDTGVMAGRLRQAGIDQADGFSLNVSNFQTNENTEHYGQQLSQQLDGKHFVIDTSRNGNGPYLNQAEPAYNWCNPPGRALGHYPTTDTGQELVDAYLYIKSPGESDGQDNDPDKCHGGPKAGEWWPEYALDLVRNWPDELQPK